MLNEEKEEKRNKHFETIKTLINGGKKLLSIVPFCDIF